LVAIQLQFILINSGTRPLHRYNVTWNWIQLVFNKLFTIVSITTLIISNTIIIIIITARRPDIVVIDKVKKEALIIDVAIPADHNICEKETEKKLQNTKTLRWNFSNSGI
jgi:hypothetical protein